MDAKKGKWSVCPPFPLLVLLSNCTSPPLPVQMSSNLIPTTCQQSSFLAQALRKLLKCLLGFPINPRFKADLRREAKNLQWGQIEPVDREAICSFVKHCVILLAFTAVSGVVTETI